MSNCDCQKNIKNPINDGSTVDTTAPKKPIGDGPLITTVAATAAGIFFGLRAVDMGQHNALITSRWLVYLLPFFWSDDLKNLYNK